MDVTISKTVLFFVLSFSETAVNPSIFTYVSPGHLHGGVAVDVAEQAQAEALRVGRVGEAVDG